MGGDQLLELASKLGISDKQLATLRKKYPPDEALTRRLKRWIEETRDRPKLLGKTGGYTERPGFALRVVVRTEVGTEGEPEAVDDVTQKRLTREARAAERDALEQMIAAMEQVRAALDDRIRNNPDLQRAIGKELWQIRGRIDAAKARLKRRMAA